MQGSTNLKVEIVDRPVPYPKFLDSCTIALRFAPNDSANKQLVYAHESRFTFVDFPRNILTLLRQTQKYDLAILLYNNITFLEKYL